MDILQSCYETEIPKVKFLERKITITHPKTLLKGPPSAGKTYLIYDFLARFSKSDYLYLDFLDLRNDFGKFRDTFKNSLENFINKNKIKILVLENFDFDFQLLYCDNIIITSKQDFCPFGFKILKLMPLDFEEFLLHESKFQNITASFNAFFRFGNFSELVNLDEPLKIKRMQEILRLNTKDEIELSCLRIFFDSIGEKKSLLQLFGNLKKINKISKDRFYNLSNKYLENSWIFFLQKYKNPKAVKKIFTYNHAFLNLSSYNKKFKNEFENMVFLELLKLNEEIYYLDNADFFLEISNKIILASPFFSELILEQNKEKILKSIKESSCKNLEIVTIANTNNLSFDDININVIPFYEWSLSQS